MADEVCRNGACESTKSEPESNEKPTLPDQSGCQNECSEGESKCLDAVTFGTCTKGANRCLSWNRKTCAPDESCQSRGCEKIDYAKQIRVGLGFPWLDNPDPKHKNVFAIASSHLVGQGFPSFVTLVIQNVSQESLGTLTVTVSMNGWGTQPGSKSLALPPGSTQSVSLSPGFDFQKLFEQTSDVPARVVVEIISSTKGRLYQKDVDFKLLGRNTWHKIAPNGKPWLSSVCTFITPADKAKAVQGIIAGAGAKSEYGMNGYQKPGLVKKELYFRPGGNVIGYSLMDKGEGLGVVIHSTDPPGADIDLLILDPENCNKFLDEKPVTAMKVSKKHPRDTAFSFDAPSSGWHCLAAYNHSGKYLKVSTTRAITWFDVTFDQIKAIFLHLRSRGVTYSNTTNAFQQASQYVRFPHESVKEKTANCIDGTVLIASALEQMGMRPLLFFVPGHAYVGVYISGSSNLWIPIETTAVGKPDVEAFMAVFGAYLNAIESYGKKELLGVDVKKDCRDKKILPAPL